MPFTGPEMPFKDDLTSRWVSEYPFSNKGPRKPREEHFKAPEHHRISSDMRRDYPRDDWGRKIPGSSRELVVDNRPTILKEEEKRRKELQIPN